MKYYSYAHKGNKIEFFKTYFGKETVFVNEKLVSEEHSITGAAHFFKIDGHEILLKTNYNLVVSTKVCIQLFKNRKLINASVFQFKRRHRVSLITITLLFIISVVRLVYIT